MELVLYSTNSQNNNKNMSLVKHCSLTKSSWNALGDLRDSSTIYFLTDTKEIAKGSDIYYQGAMRYLGVVRDIPSHAEVGDCYMVDAYTNVDNYVTWGLGTNEPYELHNYMTSLTPGDIFMFVANYDQLSNDRDFNWFNRNVRVIQSQVAISKTVENGVFNITFKN